MSYSFSCKGCDKKDAIVAVRSELMEVVRQMPEHHVDFDQALAAAKGVINTLQDAPGMDVSVSMNGSVWTELQGARSVSVSVSAWLDARPPPPEDAPLA